MNQAPESARPVPMEGDGEYNRSSTVQAAGLSPAVRSLVAAAQGAELAPNGEPIVIADYGSSQGGNSLEPLALAIQALRERAGGQRAVTVFHTDLPGNDFTALFQCLADDPRSYLRRTANVFPAAIGRSFYEQILPAASVTLGWSSWAVQWLSQAPTPFPVQVQVAYSQDAATKALYAEQAAADWRIFLMHRGAELRSGGWLVVLTMALDDSGCFGYEPLLEAMYGTLVELAQTGTITPDELLRMTIPTVGRSRADLLAPFQPAGHGRFAGLAVEEVEMFQGDDRIWTQYQQDRDAKTFGEQWAAFSRASVFPTLAADLNGGPADPRAEEFVLRLHAGMAQKLALRPARMGIPLARMVLRKKE